MQFYTFKQNNSGGSFDEDERAGIGYAVCIEAQSAAEANDRALAIGLYFDGSDSGADCPCCGDRWYPAYEDEAEQRPSIYGRPLSGGWGHASYIHYADGRIERVPA